MNTVGNAVSTGDVASVEISAALSGLTMVGPTNADAGACADGMCTVPEPAPTR